MSKRFKGEYNHSIDAKGRVSVPSKFRELLGDVFTITVGEENCIWVYTQEEWEVFEKILSELPITTNKVARALNRRYLSGASEVEPDKQGRILIPNSLREFAGLEKDVVFIGVGNRAEIWSKERWDAYNEEVISQDYSEELEKLGVQF